MTRRQFVLVFALLLAATGAAHADMTLRVVESGGGSWADAVQALRDHGQPLHAIHVQAVDEHGEVVACRDYHLVLDANAQRAFSVGDCDPVSNATELCFADRHFLFSHPDDIAQPIVPSVVAVPPPPPPPPHSGSETCWALVGPRIIDLETGERKTVVPSHVALDFAPTTPTIPIQTIGFDKGWLVRVDKSAGITELGYALVPWMTGSRRRQGPWVVPQPPSGLVHLPLRLRCDGDPLGDQTVTPPPREPTLVPERLSTVDQSGAPVTLRRARSDRALAAQQLLGLIVLPLSAVTAIDTTIFVELGKNTPRNKEIGAGVIGAAVGLAIGSGFMVAGGARDLAVRHGTKTVAFDPARLALHF